MDASFEPLFSVGSPAQSFLPPKLTAQTLNLSTGLYGDTVDLKVAKEHPSKFTNPWILAASGRKQEPPLLRKKLLFDPCGPSSLATAIYSQAKTIKFGMILSDRLSVRTLVGSDHSMSKRVGHETHAGNMAFVVSALSKDHVDRRAPPKLMMGKEPQPDIYKPDVVDVSQGMHWTFRGERGAEKQEPPPPIKDGSNPKQGQQSSKSPRANKAIGAIKETKQK
ncbi:uncharacterized protein Z520_09814 [Fonsecaea multimorphosa CBS 102226]|uniref:Uncharacterized protein n=1 Tax=Fonsecaea multimorphosa CBS 102226 TaxID=1442371 RepID=A0A0D2KCM2_9EURO|nr:uncharacterized protein Z520_09814 [Fonsecaea multimorphosa CBS 102226]KIX94428.1 hypothetical protein Z520_09814 [Fonsecaea multimorphosa CBS 102226]OAL20009.1 hypothetical protein AYO22_09159 [Fonsecaea multimorphosa]